MKLAPFVILLCMLSPWVSADVEVLGLFKDAAYLKVGGEEKLVKVGTSFAGVHVIEADARKARITYQGREQTVTVSQRISASYSEAPRKQVLIRTNRNHQYVTRAEINGRSTEVLVDTGANIMAMNSGTAAALGVQYRDAQPHQVSTASGQVWAFPVVLDSVSLGGIKINRVKATVIEGDFPSQVLLGMSYLRHVEISENSGVLMLLQKY